MLATDPRKGLVELKYSYTVHMQCNIDARGRRARIVSGLVCSRDRGNSGGGFVFQIWDLFMARRNCREPFGVRAVPDL